MTRLRYEKLLDHIDDVSLERLIAFYVDAVLKPVMPANRIGRPGTSQKGVDVYALLPDVGDVGFQAKAYHSTPLTKAAIDKELALAVKFVPPLQRYTIVTLSKRSPELQEYARQCELHGKRCVSLMFAEDIGDIAATNPALAALIIEMTLSPSDLRTIRTLADRNGGGAMGLSLEDDEPNTPPALRECEEWINNGRPGLALKKLAEYQGEVSSTARRRIECHALISLHRFEDALQLVVEELQDRTPSAPLLAVGVYAAYELDKISQAEELAAAALAAAEGQEKTSAVAAQIFIASRLKTKSIEDLEEFATQEVGDPKKVARTLGDAAVFLGIPSRGLYWYDLAAEASPVRTLATQINHACCALLVLLDKREAGELNSGSIKRSIRKLEELVDQSQSSDSPDFLFVLQNTLSFAYEAIEKYEEALHALDEALSRSEGREGLWIKRCLLCANGFAPVPGEALSVRHLRGPASYLAFAMAKTLAGDFDGAEVTIESVLSRDDVDVELRSAIFVERLRLGQARDTGQTEVLADDAIAHLTSENNPIHIVGWLLNAYPALRDDQRRAIQEAVSRLVPADICDDGVEALSTKIVSLGLASFCVGWRKRIKQVALGPDGQVLNFSLALTLARLEMEVLGFAVALELVDKLFKIRPRSAILWLQYANILYAKGARTEAFEALEHALKDGVVSVALVHKWAILAVSLGFHRRAQALLKTLKLPAPVTSDDFARIMHVRTMLRVRASGDDVFDGLRRGLLTPTNAAKLFDMARRSRSPELHVQEDVVVKIRSDGIADSTFYISSSSSTPVPGVETYSVSSHPWLREIYGAKLGDTISIAASPFHGAQVVVAEVWSPWEWMFRSAAKVLQLADPNQTGVRSINGHLDDQLEQARQLVLSSQESFTHAAGEHISRRLPISLLADARNVSAREFLSSGPGWEPASGEGSADMRSAEDALLAKSNIFIIDPVTFLLICTLNVEGLLARLAIKPLMTRQSVWALFDWYQLERQRFKGVGFLNVDASGRLVLVQNSAKTRLKEMQFWERVKKAVLDVVEIVDPPVIGEARHGALSVSLVGAPMAGEVAYASEVRGVLLSEEYIVRALAESTAQCSASTLHGLILHAVNVGWLSRTKATVSLATLISFGWNWISFGRWMIDHALRLSPPRREACIVAFLSRTGTADPGVASSTLLSVLRTLDQGGYSGVNESWLRRAVIRALPRLSAHDRAVIVRSYVAGAVRSRRRQATLRALREWADRGI